MENSIQLGNAMSVLSQALRQNNPKLFLNSAESILTVCDSGKITAKFLPVAFMYSALSYEIAGEPIRARNPYLKLLSKLTIPTEPSISHEGILHHFNKFMYCFGTRNILSGLEEGNNIINKIKELNESKDPRFSDSNDDETITFIGIIEAILSYMETLKKYDLGELGELSKFLEKYNERLSKSTASSWLTVLGRLTVYAINEIVPRTLLKAQIPKSIGSQLLNQKIVEFWEPQQEAINNGILKGQNLVLTTPTASGKTLLSTIIATKSKESSKTIMITPTRTLAYEAYSIISKHLHNTSLKAALSTREKTNSDKDLSEYPILVATYEKFSSLLKRNIVPINQLKSVIIDEAHYIADEDRGIPLEFLIKSIKQSTANNTQIVALSGMINEENATQLSRWINAKNVRSKWRPVELDETVLFEGNLYHKNNSKTSIPIGDVKTAKSEERRFWLAKKIALEEKDKNKQCMIVVNSRTKTEDECKKLLDELNNKQLTLLDAEIPDYFEPGRKHISKMVRNVEPELPPFARQLSEMIKNGIAYHHAGLPERYRHLVEYAVRSNAVNILFTTSTLEAGVNLPVSTVVFPNLKSRLGKFTGPISISRYKNLAGRAGRPGYDRKGRSIIITLDQEECEDLLQKYVKNDAEKINSSINYFLKKRPTPRYSIQSEILNILSEKRILTKNEIIDTLQDTWFATTENKEKMTEFKTAFSFELYKLTQYGCIKESNGNYSIENIGESARNSMLFAFSMTRIVRNLKKIIEFDGEKFDILILSLVALPWELQSYDDIIKKVKPSSETNFVSKIIVDDNQLRELYQRSQFAPKFATILWNWINSKSTTNIIEECELSDSHSAFIEEILKEDAFWILNSISRLSNKTIKLPESKKSRIKQLAMFCRIGSSDPLVRDIFRLNFRSVGRSTAIKLASYFKKKSIDKVTMKELLEIPKETFLKLFPDNKESAEILYEEIQKSS